MARAVADPTRRDLVFESLPSVGWVCCAPGPLHDRRPGNPRHEGRRSLLSRGPHRPRLGLPGVRHRPRRARRARPRRKLVPRRESWRSRLRRRREGRATRAGGRPQARDRGHVRRRRGGRSSQLPAGELRRGRRSGRPRRHGDGDDRDARPAPGATQGHGVHHGRRRRLRLRRRQGHRHGAVDRRHRRHQPDQPAGPEPRRRGNLRHGPGRDRRRGRPSPDRGLHVQERRLLRGRLPAPTGDRGTRGTRLPGHGRRRPHDGESDRGRLRARRPRPDDHGVRG